MQRVQHIQDEQIELQPRQCGQSRQVRDAPVKNGPAGLWPCCPWQEVALSSIWADVLQGHVLSTGNCSKLFQGQRRSAVSVKSPSHTYCFLNFLVAHFNWLSGLLSPAFCCRLFSTALPLQLLATATKAIYTLPAIQIHYIYYIYLSDLNKTLLFWRPVRFAGIMHSGGSLGLGVTAPTRAANNDPFSLSMLVSREIEFCSLVLVLVLVKENPKNKWTYPNLCIWLL